mmetsp:Transcript_27716/g.88105  ORF Transcript_27716/g.88105 Transcript_27716/m.88105 type:complete len:250 (-) Transcript_27716:191-940(-)
MDPITLNFDIFQAGVPAQSRRSLEVVDPQGTTVGSLKRQLFSAELEAQQSVRFIAAGRVLEDAALLGQCGLGSKAFVQVSISAATPSGALAQPPATGAGVMRSGLLNEGCASRGSCEDTGIGARLICGVFFFAGTGVLLQLAWQKRRHMPIHTSQLFCILAAVWVHLLLCHGLPALARGLRAVGRVAGSMPKCAATSPSRSAAEAEPAEPSVPESAASPASLSALPMTPLLPDGRRAVRPCGTPDGPWT